METHILIQKSVPDGGPASGLAASDARRGTRFLRWLRSGNTDERYLAAAADLADLERRMRALERASGEASIVTLDR